MHLFYYENGPLVTNKDNMRIDFLQGEAGAIDEGRVSRGQYIEERKVIKFSIVIPVYNEESAIEPLFTSLKNLKDRMKQPFEIIAVDDGSSDKTASKLQKFDIKVLSHNNNKGYGAALKTGIRNASGDIIITLDGDNTYHPRDIQSLAELDDRYDMVVGARVIDSSRCFPFHQKLAKGFICSLLAMIFKQKIPDINSGLRLMKKKVVEKYLPILPDGFSFTASITLAMLLDNYKIGYFPVGYSKRTGKSKVNVLNYTLNFIKSYWRIIYNLKFIDKQIRI